MAVALDGEEPAHSGITQDHADPEIDAAKPVDAIGLAASSQF